MKKIDNKILISVIFSFRNEEDVITEMIQRLRKILEGLSVRFEMIFVNDASDDNSLDLLMRYHQQDPRVKIINMSRIFELSGELLPHSGDHGAADQPLLHASGETGEDRPLPLRRNSGGGSG